ncbi:hypothetical protein Pelo_13940 [Pelomyxa schiedti]|nr:hypothetical protein Pelo_13940 [Pelomyxa schiedti]
MAADEQVLNKLREVRSELAHDVAAVESLVTKASCAPTSLANTQSPSHNGVQTPSTTTDADLIHDLQEENKLLKVQVERLNYRILHLCQSLDQANSKLGVQTKPTSSS